MAKAVMVEYAGNLSSFALTKVERAKLYPSRKRLALDAAGQPCTRASLMSDGVTLLRSGMTAQGYFTESGRWVTKDEMVGIHPDGSVVPLIPSTLGVPQTLEGPVMPRQLLDLDVLGVYTLEAESANEALMQSLKSGDIYRFPFNYGADYHCEQAFLLANDEGVFAIVGTPLEREWVEAATVYVAEEAPEDALGDDLDFDMM